MGNHLFLLSYCVLLLLLLLNPYSIGVKSFTPKALLLAVSKDPSTNHYVTTLSQRTPLVPVKLTLDLGGQYLWVDCDQGYVSSSYKPVRCGSAQCSLAKSRGCLDDCHGPPKPGCHNNSCPLLPANTVISYSTSGEAGQDVVSIHSTDGSNPGPTVSVPKFMFACGSTFLLEGLARGVKGMAGLGRTMISLPSQFSSAFRFDRKFAVCLTGGGSNGVVFFGGGPYVLLPNVDVSQSLVYTPLILNPVSSVSSFEGHSTEYFIGVKSIKINGNTVPLNATLLEIDRDGFGGTKISTVDPYTVMHSSIYKAVLKSFEKELASVPRVKPVAPFGLCYNSTSIGSTRVGPAVPAVDLVLQGSHVVWRIWGSNSMVRVKEDVLCLAFVDGGDSARTSIVIGGHQLEDNMLQFDLEASKLGFSSTLLMRRTNCGNFNFTSNYRSWSDI